MKNGKRKVVASAEEARMAQKAEAMKKAGFRSFESVYGPTGPAAFSLDADLAAMQEVGMMTDEEAIKMAQGATNDTVPEIPPQMPQIAPQGMLPTQEAVEPNDEEEPNMELSSDPEKRLGQIAEALAKINPNAPTAEILKGWKQMHGDIFLLNIDDKVFIYRYLKRQEHIQINANPRINEMQEHQIEEMLFDRCILWPKMDPARKAGMPAGAMGMVVAQIRLQSLFLDPAAVAQMTIKI